MVNIMFTIPWLTNNCNRCKLDTIWIGKDVRTCVDIGEKRFCCLFWQYFYI